MLEWIVDNFDTFFSILGKVVFAGSALVGMTKSTKVGSFWSKVLKVADVVSIFNTPETKEKLKQANEKIKNK